MLHLVKLKCWNHSITTRNYAVIYYKTLEEATERWVGAIVAGRSTVGVSLTSSALHNISKSLQNSELKQN